MARKKRKDRAKQNARRKQRRKPRPAAPRLAPASAFAEDEIPHPREVALDPPALERCYPPVHVTDGLHRVPDPHARLGLDPAADPSPADIRAAWRRALEEHPPEREPETARALTAARDRLLAPERFMERRLGVLHVPDPAALGLPSPEAPPSLPAHRLGARPRLLGQLALYALLAAELAQDRPRPRPHQEELPF